MNKESSTYKSNFYSITNSILFLLCITTSHNSIVISAIFTVVLLINYYIEKKLKATVVDALIILLFLYELVLGLFTSGTNNCLEPILNQYNFTAYYFILRLSLNDSRALRNFFVFTSIIIALVAMISMVSFEIFKNKVTSAGFDNLYDFKHLYRPFGELNNLWASIFLAFLAILLLGICIFNSQGKMKWYNFIPIFPLMYCLLVSFSRGIYIAIGSLFLITISLIIFTKIRASKKILYVAAIVITLGCIAMPNKTDVMRTMKMTETESQRRSLAGRVHSLAFLGPALAKNPLLGVGSNNYSLAVNEYFYEDDNNSFTDFAPNIISQILIEKGIIGTVLWGAIYIICVWWLITTHTKAIDRRVPISILLLVTIILIRELTFPTLLTDIRMLIFLAIFLAIFLSNYNNYLQVFTVKVVPGIVITMLLYCYVISCYIVFEKDGKHYKTYISRLEEARFDDAAASLNNARNTLPTFFFRAILNWRAYNKTRDDSYLKKTEKYLLDAINQNKHDIQLQSYYAVVRYYLNDSDSARNIMKKLVAKFPNNTLYRLYLANMLYLNGECEFSASNYSQAILLSPSILEEGVQYLPVLQDTIMYNRIINDVKSSILDLPSDPILLAKYGKIWYLLGDDVHAQLYLQRAVELLPNLESPWLCLAKIAEREKDTVKLKQYQSKLKLWRYNDSMHDNATKKNDNNSPRIYNNPSYFIKFKIWYGVPMPQDILNFNIEIQSR